MKKEYSMKLFFGLVLGLILCIPLALINNLAEERRNEEDAVATQLEEEFGEEHS